MNVELILSFRRGSSGSWKRTSGSWSSSPERNAHVDVAQLEKSATLRTLRPGVRVPSSTLMSGHHKWSELRGEITPERQARIDALRAEMEEEDRKERERQMDESLTEIHRLADETGMDL